MNFTFFGDNKFQIQILKSFSFEIQTKTINDPYTQKPVKREWEHMERDVSIGFLPKIDEHDLSMRKSPWNSIHSWMYEVGKIVKKGHG